MKLKDLLFSPSVVSTPNVSVSSDAVVSGYLGNCKVKEERHRCIAPDFHPLALDRDGKIRYPDYPNAGPSVCQYHGLLVMKLKQLTLVELEYLAKRIDITTKDMHPIRMIAMRCTNEYFKKNHRRIFGCA